MYPAIVFFRYDKYSYIDSFFETKSLLCSVSIHNHNSCLNQLFNVNNPILITFGNSYEEYIQDVNAILPSRMNSRWIHLTSIDSIDQFNASVNYCFMKTIVKQTSIRPVFSIFTTCYNSYDKIKRAYSSLQEQEWKDWEWVILDDSPDEDHFKFLTNVLKEDNRIRLYKRSENSGNIGNVKNEAVSLCRGKYVLELDHDDEITSDCLLLSVQVFEDEEIGFIYMNYSNIYENGNNFHYNNYFSLGYAGYYMEKYKGKWIYVASSPNINNVTLGHIVAVPNHPRIWRKEVLMKIGNYNEFLPVSDDYELLLRTATQTKMAKINCLGYIQYMNQNENNFSLIRNSEINRLCKHITTHCYSEYNIDEIMKENNAFELYSNKPIWELENYTPVYCNEIISLYKKQYCIVGLETLYQQYGQLKELYLDKSNDFILLDNKHSIPLLCKILDKLEFSRMKCYMIECSDTQLINYFHFIYKSSDYTLFEREKCMPSPYTTICNPIPKKITIITPSIRPENLLIIQQSILFEYVNEWIIVYDGNKIKENPNLFSSDKIKEYVYSGEGRSGNSQRNYALDQVQHSDTYIYFLDDDNLIHPELYSIVDTLEDNKIYTFNQERPPDVFPFTDNLKGNRIEVFNIDSAMYLVDYKLCKDIRWNPHQYYSDGLFIMDCYSRNKDKWIYINQTLAYYNKL